MSQRFGYPPRLMQASEAARYLGISASKLRTLPLSRRLSGGNRLYDRQDLDDYADRLTYEGDDQCQDDNPADAAFGLSPATAA